MIYSLQSPAYLVRLYTQRFKSRSLVAYKRKKCFFVCCSCLRNGEKYLWKRHREIVHEVFLLHLTAQAKICLRSQATYYRDRTIGNSV